MLQCIELCEHTGLTYHYRFRGVVVTETALAVVVTCYEYESVARKHKHKPANNSQATAATTRTKFHEPGNDYMDQTKARMERLQEERSAKEERAATMPPIRIKIEREASESTVPVRLQRPSQLWTIIGKGSEDSRAEKSQLIGERPSTIKTRV